MASDGLCRYCGAYIGTDNWKSCPNCGEEFGSDDEFDDEFDDDSGDDSGFGVFGDA